MEIDLIKNELDKFYATEFQDTQEEQLENLRIKGMIFELLEKAIRSKNTDAIAITTSLILENTGCVEDIEVVNQLSQILEEKEIEIPEEIRNIMHNSATNRWL